MEEVNEVHGRDITLIKTAELRRHTAKRSRTKRRTK
jgi:hypothetical protein